MITALTGLVVLSSFILIAYCQDSSTITTSKNPVYSGEPVTLTCVLETDDGVVLSVAIDAFDETQNVGRLACRPSSFAASRNTGAGSFSGYSFIDCEAPRVKSPRFSVSLYASPSLDLHYRCTFAVHKLNLGTAHNVTSTSVRLSVFVLPTAPSLHPRSLVFNEADSLVLECNSAHGTPVADIDFVAVQQKSGNSQRNSSSTTVSLKLAGSTKDWHNAEVTCRVVNHNFPNMSARGVILVNHIAADGVSTVTVNTYSSGQHLNCSKHVISFPGATYRWSVPPEANISEWASLSSPVLTVQQGTTGLFNCSATNNLTGGTEVITFSLINEPEPFPWIVVVVVLVSVIIIITVVLVVLYKRGYLSKLVARDDHSSTNYNNDRKRDENNDRQEMHDRKSPSKSRASYPEGGRGGDDDGVVKESLIRGAQPTDDTECSELSRLKPQLKAPDRRLLIAAEGVVANLKHKTLPTTVLVNYPDHSSSLDSIIVQVGQAIPLPAPPSFKSVALLLRRLKVGSSLSEVDRAVLTSRDLTGERGDKLRDFFARLAGMSLNKRAGDTRIDILNYGGTDATQLAKALEGLLKVSVTVSSDPFGFGETNSSPHASEQSVVGADYFNRRNVDVVVYADVGMADGPLRSRPNKVGNQVLYSEIVRNV